MEVEQKYEACVAALKEYVTRVGFSDVIVGLSGGLDSSVVAAMCVEAFGAEHVHGILLPGPYSSDHSISDALDLAKCIGIKTKQMSICEAFEAFEKTFKRCYGEEMKGLASENPQARCRMIALMAVSNARNWLVINTGNKSEAMMGYSTLYGDTVGAFAPIGGLYKTDVYAVSRWVNARAEAAGRVVPIPEHVLVKPPSAELAPDQQDETSLGTTYAELDKLLIDYKERGKSVEQLIAAGYDAAEVERITKRVEAYAFKRALEPQFPVIPYAE